jgi:hypothetical protein
MTKHTVTQASIILAFFALAGSTGFAEEQVEETDRGSIRGKKFVIWVGSTTASFGTTLEQVDQITGDRTFFSLEGDLGLPKKDSVPTLSFLFQVGRKSFIVAEISRFRRSTTLLDIEESMVLDDLIIEAGARVDFKYNADAFDVAYGHAYYEGEHTRIIGKFGLFVMNLDTGLLVEGGYSIGDHSEDGTYDATASILAPIPLLGLLFDFDLPKKWALSTSVEVFYMPISTIRMKALRTKIYARYAFSDLVGVTFGLSQFSMDVRDESDDITTNVRMSMDGVYAGLSFSF